MTSQRQRTSSFILSMFREDEIRIKKLVRDIPYAETGGNLFGLWTNQGNAVVLVATGPGENCKRSSASFYQDIPYMQRVGTLLTEKYPLCHIGEWHSHHQMQLYQPSYGDCTTVQRNYPRGSQGFVLMIANILRDETVELWPYKFIDDRSPYQEGNIESIYSENPFMKVGQITRAIEEGKEKRPQNLLGIEGQRQCQGARDLYFSESKAKDIKNRARKDESYPQTRKTSRSRSRSPIKRTVDNSSSDEEHCHTIRNQRKGPVNNQTASLSKRSYHKLRKSPVQITLQTGREQSSAQNPTTQWHETAKETLEETLHFLTLLADDRKTVGICRDKTTLNVIMTFTHHNCEWSITFPCDFPRGSVQLDKKSDLQRVCSYIVKGLGDIHGFKHNLKCTLQDHCTECKSMVTSRDVLTSRHETTIGPQGSRRETHRSDHCSHWYDTQKSTLKKAIDFVTSLDDGKATPEMSRDKSTKNLTMCFKHHGRKWAIQFPPNFPWGNVKLKGSATAETSSYSYPVSYSYTNAVSLSHNVKAEGDINKFTNKLQNELRSNCEKCRKPKHRYSRNM